MPRDSSDHVTHNKLIHNITIERTSLLQKAMFGKMHTPPRRIPVNSVNWLAADDAAGLPPSVRISARSAQ
ncbi:hypothetical protein [Coxiella endosymbiont of Ornithodoros maritimus]|uniref:hypothetical protein n=1 Tax=Coxiella endosymbiont of Ornithodoros maritimus TaxID=1656172 RepID=UPI00226437EC|nr:hypothetical protein [Coxiella endosymbiont of Ornithodoros maritimus]